MQYFWQNQKNDTDVVVTSWNPFLSIIRQWEIDIPTDVRLCLSKHPVDSYHFKQDFEDKLVGQLYGHSQEIKLTFPIPPAGFIHWNMAAIQDFQFIENTHLYVYPNEIIKTPKNS